MKKVFQTKEVSHIWAQQSQNEARNAQGNFYFEGATIYSYGKHFPIATLEGENVLFTLRSYSNTTAKHIRKVRGAVSHKNIIFCYDVPVKYHGDSKPLNKQSFTLTHEKNTNFWKGEIKRLFSELGNKRNRDAQSRINGINQNIEQLNAYCSYFGLKVKDRELKTFLSIALKPDFIELARDAKAKEIAANEKKMKRAIRAYEIYLNYWRDFNEDAITHLPQETKDLCNFYRSNKTAFTHLRINIEKNRLETSKGVEIPLTIAKKAYKQLNGCMEASCNELSIPVMSYTITETGKDYIKAGCHTIPKEDVKYVAEAMGW